MTSHAPRRPLPPIPTKQHKTSQGQSEKGEKKVGDCTLRERTNTGKLRHSKSMGSFKELSVLAMKEGYKIRIDNHKRTGRIITEEITFELEDTSNPRKRIPSGTRNISQPSYCSPRRQRTFARLEKNTQQEQTSWTYTKNTEPVRKATFMEIAPKARIERASVMKTSKDLEEEPWVRRKITLQNSAPMLLQKYHVLNTLEDHQMVMGVCNMVELGIRTSVEKYTHCDLLPVVDDQLLMRQHHYRFTKTGEFDAVHGVTYKSNYEFTFTDYSPFLFRVLRQRYGHSCEEYVDSLCGTETNPHLESMIGDGKSNASFLISKDKRYILKSLQSKEFQFLQQMLCDYYEHILAEPNTLLSRFYGLFQLTRDHTTHTFVIMENFIPPIPGIVRYDLKGSTYGRVATEEQKKAGATLKDLDFSAFILGPTSRSIFWDQLEEDAAFLQRHDIMDYSLLVGVREMDSVMDKQKIGENMEGADSELQVQSYFNSFHGGMQASYETEEPYPAIYYLGIIDILQPFNLKKKVENVIKRIKESQQEISCVDPETYASRFLQFLKEKTYSILNKDFQIVQEEDLSSEDQLWHSE